MENIHYNIKCNTTQKTPYLRCFLAGDERIELPPKVLETPIIPFDQSPIYRKNLTPVAALNFLGTFILYLQNFTQKASNLTPSNNQQLFQSKLYSLLCMP